MVPIKWIMTRDTTKKNIDFSLTPPPADDTIIAVSSPYGRGAIGLIRISGPLVLSALNRLCKPVSGSKFLPRKSVLSEFLSSDGEFIDEGLVVYFPAPNSYTGEDVAELSFHGNPLILRHFILESLKIEGIRPAEPGEFTRRAYLNQKLDLPRAEAVTRIIDAKSDYELIAGRKMLRGELGKILSRFRSAMISLKAETEAEVDFSTEDLTFENREVRIKTIRSLIDEIDRILEKSAVASRIAGGVRIAIVGLPNAGKSSLMNAMLGWDRSIVSHIEGTTRDYLSEDMEIDGVGVKFIDTAGLRETSDEIEKEGVRRSKSEIQKSNIILHVIDSKSGKIDSIDSVREFMQSAKIIHIFNKSDLAEKQGDADVFEGEESIFLSCKTGENLGLLKEIIKNIIFTNPSSKDPMLLEERHRYHFERIKTALLRVIELWHQNAPDEIAAIEIDSALSHIGEISGKVSTEEVLGRIFSMFCIGK